jgi:hypothetical protein
LRYQLALSVAAQALARWLQRASAMKSLFNFMAGAALIACYACSTSKPANDPGPAQKAGAAVDEGAEDAKESAKEAGDKVGDATEKAGDKIQEKSGD